MELYSIKLGKYMVLRDISINENIKAGKVLIVYGARRVGKTYLLHSYLDKCGLK